MESGRGRINVNASHHLKKDLNFTNENNPSASSAAAATFLPGTPVRAEVSDFDDADSLNGNTAAQRDLSGRVDREGSGRFFFYNGLTGPVITIGTLI